MPPAPGNGNKTVLTSIGVVVSLFAVLGPVLSFFIATATIEVKVQHNTDAIVKLEKRDKELLEAINKVGTQVNGVDNRVGQVLVMLQGRLP